MEKFMRSNLFAWILALFLAIAMWLFVMADNITRTTPARKQYREIPLTVENLADGLMIMEMPATVSVTLEGLSEDFDGLSGAELEAYIDAAGTGPGAHLMRVRGTPPHGLRLVHFSPEQVNITIEQIDSAVFQVFVEFFGQPAEGWTRRTFSMDPMQIRAEAPRSVFEQIHRVVLRVDQNGMRDQYRQDLTPVSVDRQGAEVAGVTLIPERIAVSITLVQVEDDAP